jgi:hypothetical protein
LRASARAARASRSGSHGDGKRGMAAIGYARKAEVARFLLLLVRAGSSKPRHKTCDCLYRMALGTLMKVALMQGKKNL